jgi:hypothetical protein
MAALCVALFYGVAKIDDSICEREIASGLVRYECRHHVEQCRLYWGDDCPPDAPYFEIERIGTGFIARRVP